MLAGIDVPGAPRTNGTGKVFAVTVLREKSTAEPRPGRRPRQFWTGTARARRAAGTPGSVRGALRACRGRGVVPPSPRARPRAGLCPRQCVDVSGEEGPSVRALSASPPGPRGCWDEGQTSASRCRFRFQGAGRL